MNWPETPTPRFAAFQHRDYRLQWYGQLLSLVGTQMQLTAVDWHVYSILKGSTYTLSLAGMSINIGTDALGLGLLGLVRIIPIIFFASYGGMVADVLDRRRILIWGQIMAAFFAGLLAILTLSGKDSIPVIYVLSAVMAAVTAFSNPARQALVANLVPREHLANAMSLNNVMWQLATIAGPAVTGAILSRFGNAGLGLVYVFNAVSFGFMLAALLMMSYRGEDRDVRSGLHWNSMIEGLRFTYDSRIIWGSMMLDFLATFFSSARTMLPIVADSILHSGPQGFGLLSTAQSVGAVIVAAALSVRTDLKREGIILLASVVIYGLATALFGMTGWFTLSYFLLAITGAADTVSTVIRSTLRNLITPDHLRGRMTGINMIFFTGGPQLGELEAGLVASVLGVPFAIISGGIATVMLTLYIAWKYPTLREYSTDPEKQIARAQP